MLDSYTIVRNTDNVTVKEETKLAEGSAKTVDVKIADVMDDFTVTATFVNRTYNAKLKIVDKDGTEITDENLVQFKGADGKYKAVKSGSVVEVVFDNNVNIGLTSTGNGYKITKYTITDASTSKVKTATESNCSDFNFKVTKKAFLKSRSASRSSKTLTKCPPNRQGFGSVGFLYHESTIPGGFQIRKPPGIAVYVCYTVLTGRKTPMLLQSPCQYTKYCLRAFHCLNAFLLRQNCCAPDSDGFLCDFWFLSRRRADARQGEKDKKHPCALHAKPSEVGLHGKGRRRLLSAAFCGGLFWCV